MKKLFYIVLIIAALFLASTFIKQKSINNTTKAIQAEEVVEENPEITGAEDETIISDADVILPEEDTGEAEPETIISE